MIAFAPLPTYAVRATHARAAGFRSEAAFVASSEAVALVALVAKAGTAVAGTGASAINWQATRAARAAQARAAGLGSEAAVVTSDKAVALIVPVAEAGTAPARADTAGSYPAACGAPAAAADASGTSGAIRHRDT